MKNIDKALKAAPKFIVMVQDKGDGNRRGAVPNWDANNVDCTYDDGFWFFTAMDGKHLIKELKRHTLPNRVMHPFSLTLDGVKFIPKMAKAILNRS